MYTQTSFMRMRFLWFLWRVPFTINQKHIASSGSTGPAFLSAIVRNVSALVMSSSQWSTYRHEHAILLYFEGREMSRERRRGEGLKKRELLWIIDWVEPINQGACCSEFPTYQFFIVTLLGICEQTTEGLQNYLSTIKVNKKTCHEKFVLFG